MALYIYFFFFYTAIVVHYICNIFSGVERKQCNIMFSRYYLEFPVQNNCLFHSSKDDIVIPFHKQRIFKIIAQIISVLKLTHDSFFFFHTILVCLESITNIVHYHRKCRIPLSQLSHEFTVVYAVCCSNLYYMRPLYISRFHSTPVYLEYMIIVHICCARFIRVRVL